MIAVTKTHQTDGIFAEMNDQEATTAAALPSKRSDSVNVSGILSVRKRRGTLSTPKGKF